MSIGGIGAGYPIWRGMGKTQGNNSGAGFASRIDDVVRTNTSENSRKTNVISMRDSYVGINTADIYGIGAYSGNSLYMRAEGNDSARVLPGGGLEQADSQESESKTEIIVKPDGSRVLVMTMSIGGMETTMSLEISKPTKAPNDNKEQDTDRNLSSAETENEISNSAAD